jgi:hypothetical protein
LLFIKKGCDFRGQILQITWCEEAISMRTRQSAPRGEYSKLQPIPIGKFLPIIGLGALAIAGFQSPVQASPLYPGLASPPPSPELGIGGPQDLPTDPSASIAPPGEVNPEPVNSDAINPDATNPDAIFSEAAKPEVIKPETVHPKLEISTLNDLQTVSAASPEELSPQEPSLTGVAPASAAVPIAPTPPVDLGEPVIPTNSPVAVENTTQPVAESLPSEQTPFMVPSSLAQGEIPSVDPIEVDETAGSRPRLKLDPTDPDQRPFRARSDVVLEGPTRYGPGISILVPTAYGKSLGQLSVGFGFQHRTRLSDNSDGALGLSVGLGDPDKVVGVDVGLTFTDLSKPGERGVVSFKVHRRLPHQWAIAVGVNDAVDWGKSDVDGPSPYGVISKTFILKQDAREPFSRVYVTAGVGTGRYRTEGDIIVDRQDPNPFGGVALRLLDPITIITEWSGQDLSVGFSVRPIPRIPLIITPAATDITGSAGTGVRFILGVGYTFDF